MALTDAISIACKSLGIGANVWWNSERTKHNLPQPKQPTETNTPLTLESAKTLVISFGKYKGTKLYDITDKSYIEWLEENGKDDIKQAIKLLKDAKQHLHKGD